MIHEELCTYEVCKLAKEKGFNCKCYHYYQKGELQTDKCFNRYNKGVDSICSAPTQSLLQRWLREEKSIDFEIYPIFINGVRVYTCYAYAPKLNKPKKFNYFDTYELALSDALKYALENLVI